MHSRSIIEVAYVGAGAVSRDVPTGRLDMLQAAIILAKLGTFDAEVTFASARATPKC